MLYDLLRQQAMPRGWSFDIQSWETWLIGGLYILVAISSILYYRLLRRTNAVYAVTLGALRVLPRSDAYGLKTTSSSVVPTIAPLQAASNTTSFSIVDLVNQIRHVDIAIMILFFVVSVLSVAMIIRMINSLRARRSFLYLELKGNNQIMHICPMAFPTATRQYGVLLPSNGVQLSLDNYCLFGTLTINSLDWQIFNTITELNISAPRHIRLFPHKVKQLQNILQTDFVTTLFVVHTHEYVFHQEPQRSFTLGSVSSARDWA